MATSSFLPGFCFVFLKTLNMTEILSVFWLLSLRKIASSLCLLKLNKKCCFHKVPANTEEQSCSKKSFWAVIFGNGQRQGGTLEPKPDPSESCLTLRKGAAACPQECPSHFAKNSLLLSGSSSWLHIVLMISVLNSGCLCAVSKLLPFGLLAVSFPCVSQEFLPVLKPNPGFATSLYKHVFSSLSGRSCFGTNM